MIEPARRLGRALPPGMAPAVVGGMVTAALLSLSAVASCAGRAAQDPPIDEANVERLVRTLAADEMRGRRAFTPAAEAAAEFIAAEFAAIGLETFAGSAGYLQTFPVYSVSTEACSATINGTDIPDRRLVCGAASESIEWNTGDGTEKAVLDAGDNPMRALQEARRGGGDVLIVVPREQRQTFERLRRFFARPNRSLDLDAASSIVMVLADDPEVTSYRIRGSASVDESRISNVVGMIAGERSDEIVLISAHHDHIGIVEGAGADTIANGANDDASGTAAVIELARYFAARARPERTLLFTTFTAEEAGGYGSRFFSGQLDPDGIVAMFNIEMIGKPGSRGPNSAWITGFERSDFGKILQSAVEGTDYVFYPDPYPAQNLFYRSDNATLARLGVPAHSISTTPIDVDPDYHRVTDEVETLDLDHLTSTIRAIAAAAATIISGEATPTRVDPATVR